MGCGASNSAAVATPSRTAPPNRAGSSSGAVPVLTSKPLSMPKTYRHGAPITQGDLNNQRNEFWSTRIDGSTIMWQTLRSASEALLSEDLALANAILEASHILSPNGSLEICYDERGFQYKIPQFCYVNPVELTSSNQAQPTNSSTPTNSSRLATATEPMIGSGTSVKLRVRINPGDHNLTVHIDPIFTILHLKQHIVVEANKNLPSISISADRQRMIFMGKELTNATKVQDAKFDDSKVVQVFLRPEAKK